MVWSVRWLVVCIGVSLSVFTTASTEFVIVTASYNNKEWYEKNLHSIFYQTYDQWRLVYIDDCSTDDTADLVREYVHACGMEHKVTLIRNTQRHGHLYNQYHAIHAAAPTAVIVIVDGDDWLAHEQVLENLDNIYRTENVWLTYGQFWYWKKDRRGICRQLPDAVIATNTCRYYPLWVLSHLRTFYAGLFQAIKKDDLCYNGNFFPMVADAAMMYPMVEMAAERVRFIPEILYIYNDANQLSFFHDRKEEQAKCRSLLALRPRYQRMVKLPGGKE